MNRLACFWRTFKCAVLGHRPAKLRSATLNVNGQRPVQVYLCARCTGAFSARLALGPAAPMLRRT